MQTWFETWFDSPYYHILYQKRDFNEAKSFIDNLVQYLKPQPESKILDLACGAGRYSTYLAQHGFEVVGLDLSENSINEAKLNETERLDFFVHDMRKQFRTNYFDFVFNFFTSFGYFENERDNVNTFANIAKNLKPSGILVVDFFNSHKVISNLIPTQQIVKEGITFDTKKYISNGYIFKEIQFLAENKAYHFTEKVQLLNENDFVKLASQFGLNLQEKFGSYDLKPFELDSSDRLILVFKKN